MEGQCTARAAVSVNVTVPKEESAATVQFTGRVKLNTAFVNVLREQRVYVDEDSLFDGSSYDSGEPETSAMFARITAEAWNVFLTSISSAKSCWAALWIPHR